MTSADVHLTIILSFISVLGLPTLALLFRMQARWTQSQSRLADVAHDVEQLAAAMDRRVTWLERNYWNLAPGGRRRPPREDT
jgi:hypothetical protein